MPTLEWIGKDKVVNHHLDVPYRVLEHKYSYDENGQHDEDNGSENMIIHGDNLEALKALLPRYEGRIKCVYIDPPYNTAKSSDKNKAWIYSDSVDDPRISKWLNTTVGDEGDDLTRHDKWLCMMYPRLKLLQKLLSEDGSIFISIDDNEYANLKLICDEIFGGFNLVKSFVWYTDGHTDNQDSVTSVHEYILCYAKRKDRLIYNSVIDPNIETGSKILRDFAENSITKNGFKNPPSKVILPPGFPCEVEWLQLCKTDRVDAFMQEVEKVGYITRDLTKKFAVKYPIRLDDMIVKNYCLVSECTVYSGWMNVEKLKYFIDNGCQPIVDGNTLLNFYISRNGVLYYRRSGRKSHYIQTIFEKMGTTETNKYMIEKMGLNFDYPKPLELIKYLLSFFLKPNDIVLDSFAGSGTTAHAVLNMNKVDNGNRKFILVEMMDYADSITAERVKHVIQGYGQGKNATEGTGGDFSFYDLGDPLLNGDFLNEDVDMDIIREYVYFTETKSPLPEPHTEEPYYMGIHENNAYYFYYERKTTTTLNREFLHTIKTRANAYVIYADLCMFSEAELEKYHITFKKISRDITKL